MLSHFPRSEIDSAGGGIEQPEIGIPLIRVSGVSSIGFGHRFDCGDGLRARHLFRDFWLVAFDGNLPDYFAGEIEYLFRLIDFPASTIPTQPLAPQGTITQVIGVALGKCKRKPVIRKRRNLLDTWFWR